MHALAFIARSTRSTSRMASTAATSAGANFSARAHEPAMELSLAAIGGWPLHWRARRLDRLLPATSANRRRSGRRQSGRSKARPEAMDFFGGWCRGFARRHRTLVRTYRRFGSVHEPGRASGADYARQLRDASD